jgi:hypothetical protein
MQQDDLHRNVLNQILAPWLVVRHSGLTGPFLFRSGLECGLWKTCFRAISLLSTCRFYFRLATIHVLDEYDRLLVLRAKHHAVGCANRYAVSYLGCTFAGQRSTMIKAMSIVSLSVDLPDDVKHMPGRSRSLLRRASSSTRYSMQGADLLSLPTNATTTCQAQGFRNSKRAITVLLHDPVQKHPPGIDQGSLQFCLGHLQKSAHETNHAL